MQRLLTLRFVLTALAIAALQAWLPVSAYARMAGAGGSIVEICTPQGLRTIALDDDGTPVDSRPGTGAGHADHCPLCSAGPAPAITPAAGLFALAHTGDEPEGAPLRPAPALQAPPPPATGPPRHS